MYLQENPFPELPFINTLTIGIFGVLVVFILSNILETIYVVKEEQLLFKVRKYFNEKFNNKSKKNQL